jgi:hypothetical protein
METPVGMKLFVPRELIPNQFHEWIDMLLTFALSLGRLDLSPKLVLKKEIKSWLW